MATDIATSVRGDGARKRKRAVRLSTRDRVAITIMVGIPVIVTGFALPDSNIHSPNERLLADYLVLGVETAQELLRRLADV